MDDAEGRAPVPSADERGRRAELYDSIRDDGRQLAASLIRLLHAAAEDSHLNPTDFQCLVLLRLGGPLGPGEIASRLKLATGTVTSVVDRLEHHGLAHRERHPEDRRKVVVRALEGAGAAGAAGPGALSGFRRPMLDLHARYDDAELETVADWLHRVVGVLGGLADRER